MQFTVYTLNGTSKALILAKPCFGKKNIIFYQTILQKLINLIVLILFFQTQHILVSIVCVLHETITVKGRDQLFSLHVFFLRFIFYTVRFLYGSFFIRFTFYN